MFLLYDIAYHGVLVIRYFQLFFLVPPVRQDSEVGIATR